MTTLFALALLVVIAVVVLGASVAPAALFAWAMDRLEIDIPVVTFCGVAVLLVAPWALLGWYLAAHGVQLNWG